MNNQLGQHPRHRCRHIFVDGRRCGSASLRHEEFCYYHHTTRQPAANPRARKARLSALQLPIPEDRASIQLSIGLILGRLASNSLDPRRAGLLLYGLQIASTNLPPHQQLPAHARPLPEQPLEEVIAHPDHGLLAPPAEALKTRNEMWDDIYRERKMLSDQEKNLREREAALQQEKDRILLDRQTQAPREPIAADEPPASTAVPIPPSCFAPPEVQARYEAEVRAYHERLVLRSVKAHAVPRPDRARTVTRVSSRAKRNTHLNACHSERSRGICFSTTNINAPGAGCPIHDAVSSRHTRSPGSSLTGWS